jgi:hypothetical protein
MQTSPLPNLLIPRLETFAFLSPTATPKCYNRITTLKEEKPWL